MEKGENSQPKRPTLADVAQAAGVSTGTVSHALRGDRRIREQTRKKVLRTAEALGYSLDVHASALGSRKGRNRRSSQLISIALVTEEPLRANPERALETLKPTAAAMGYDLGVLVVPRGESAAKHFTQAWHRGLEGLILLRVKDRPDLIEVDWSRFSVVGMGRLPERLPIPRVRPNNFTSARRLWEICWNRGYRRIGSAPLRHDPPILDDDARLGGLLSAENRHVPYEQRIPPHIGGMLDEAAFLEWVKRWEPDCVISFATSHRWWLRDAGLDIAYAACHIPEFSTSSVAGMVENGSSMLRGALDLLDQEIRHRRRGLATDPRETVVESRFQEGATLRTEREAKKLTEG